MEDKFIKHFGTDMPVAPDTIVVARMLKDQHVLRPLEARDIDWNNTLDPVEAYYVVKRGMGDG